jgi:ATP phosphoribosyltransferase regulatory subunit
MFVTEGRTGERLALRPDFTIPVCLEHLRNQAGAERYAYEGIVFRRHDSGSPERLETGCEDIGRADRARADAEMLALAIAGASAVASGSANVRIGDIGVFGALLKALGLPGRWRRRLRHSFGVPAALARNLERLSPPREQRDERLDPEIRAAARGEPHLLETLLAERASAQGLSPGVGREPAEIAARFLDQRALPDSELAANAVAVLRRFLALQCGLAEAARMLERFAAEARLDLDDALSFFTDRAEEIARLAPDMPISFEAGFGRPLDYYTGLVFEIGAPGPGEPRLRRRPLRPADGNAWRGPSDPGGRLYASPRHRRAAPMSGPLVLALPSKGRLQEQSEALLARAGLPVEKRDGRNYRGRIAGRDDIEVAFLSASEIARELAAGSVHLGITGEDLVRETIADADERIALLLPVRLRPRRCRRRRPRSVDRRLDNGGPRRRRRLASAPATAAGSGSPRNTGTSPRASSPATGLRSTGWWKPRRHRRRARGRRGGRHCRYHHHGVYAGRQPPQDPR